MLRTPFGTILMWIAVVLLYAALTFGVSWAVHAEAFSCAQVLELANGKSDQELRRLAAEHKAELRQISEADKARLFECFTAAGRRPPAIFDTTSVHRRAQSHAAPKKARVAPAVATVTPLPPMVPHVDPIEVQTVPVLPAPLPPKPKRKPMFKFEFLLYLAAAGGAWWAVRHAAVPAVGKVISWWSARKLAPKIVDVATAVEVYLPVVRNHSGQIAALLNRVQDLESAVNAGGDYPARLPLGSRDMGPLTGDPPLGVAPSATPEVIADMQAQSAKATDDTITINEDAHGHV